MKQLIVFDPSQMLAIWLGPTLLSITVVSVYVSLIHSPITPSVYRIAQVSNRMRVSPLLVRSTILELTY